MIGPDGVPTEAVLERDGRECVRCGRAGDDGDVEVTVTAVGAADDGPVVEQLVTVCGTCEDRLNGVVPAWITSADAATAIGSVLRDLTSAQGRLVGEVAATATRTTAEGDVTDPTSTEAYLSGRRRSWLGLAYVDRTVDLAAEVDLATAVDAADLDPGIPAAVHQFREHVDSLQADLGVVLELAETVVRAHGHCHVCLDPVEDRDSCSACGTTGRDTTPWERDGRLDEPTLYGSIDDRLRSAGRTTDALTELSRELAGSVFGGSSAPDRDDPNGGRRTGE